MKASDSAAALAHPLDNAILNTLLLASEKTLSPPEIAHAIAGDGDWHNLLVPIRQSAGQPRFGRSPDHLSQGQAGGPKRLPRRVSTRPAAARLFSFNRTLVSPAGNDIHVIGNYFVGGPGNSSLLFPLANTQ